MINNWILGIASDARFGTELQPGDYQSCRKSQRRVDCVFTVSGLDFAPVYHVTQRLVLHFDCMNVFLVMPSVCVNACLQVSRPFARLGRPAKITVWQACSCLGRQSEQRLAPSLHTVATCTVAMTTGDSGQVPDNELNPWLVPCSWLTSLWLCLSILILVA